jgi:hypothetical protein
MLAAEDGDLRLVNEAAHEAWVTGELQMHVQGQWHEVCRHLFDEKDAIVACKQLGYEATGAASPAPRAEPSTSHAASLSGCNGDEQRLIDCGIDDMSGVNAWRMGSRGCHSDSGGLVLACVSKPYFSQGKGSRSCASELVITSCTRVRHGYMQSTWP